MNVFIITQNEPFYIPKMIRHLLKNGDNINIVGYTIFKPHRKNKNMRHWFNERAKIYTMRELLYVFIAMFFVKISSFFNERFSVNKLLTKAGIKNITTNDVNSKKYIKELTELDIDIIISISCPQLFGKELLSVPKLSCINAHGTLLPRHRGVFGSWWTIFKNDKEAGGTIHTMELKLDAGEILWQKKFEVLSSDTQYSIAYKTKKIMAEGLLDVVGSYSKAINNPIISPYKPSYHRAPTKEEGREFHKAGKRIIKSSNISLMLSKCFS